MLVLAPLRLLAQSLAIALLVSLVVTNWLVVTGSRALHGALRKLCRFLRIRGSPTMIFSLVLTAYHLSGWLSKHHRFRVLLFRPNFSQCISQTLLSSLVVGIIFVFFTFGPPTVLTFTKPTSWELKVIFCIFSSGSLPQGVCTIVLATQCVKIVPELYCVSMMSSMSNMTSAATLLPGKFPQGCSCFPTPFIMKKLTEACSSHTGKSLKRYSQLNF